jgi:uncharacterized protein (TIGR03437 family)
MFKRLIHLALAASMMFAAVTYSYDSAGRLIKADYGTGGSITYSYDKAGNLLSRSVVAGTAAGGTITSVNTASSPASAGITANSFIEIKGTNLVPANTASTGVIWSNAPEFALGKMPTNLQGIRVTVNNKAAYIYFYCSAVTSACAADQVNALTGLDALNGNAQVVVFNNEVPSGAFSANGKPLVPSMLLFNAQGYVAATHLNFSLLGPTTLFPGASTPANPGEQVVLYAVGFGPVTTTLTEGSSTQSGSLATPLPVCKLGANNAPVSFAGLIAPGLYQLNMTVPIPQPSGDNALTCTYNGASTQAGALLTVK